MPPDLFVSITEQLAARGKRIARKIALTDESITLKGLPQSLHGMFNNTIAIALRRSQVSWFDKLPNHRARCGATPKWKDSTHWLALSGPRYFNRPIRAMGSESPIALACHRKHQIPAAAPAAVHRRGRSRITGRPRS
jgi:hypothetical protein